MNANIIIGLVAGLLSALLFASASTGTFLGLFVLFFLSPLPIAVAGLGWGWRAAAVAAASAFVAIAPLVALRAALFHLTAIGAPTVALTYLTLLNRTIAADGTGRSLVEWYPIGRVVAFAALLAGALAALGLLTTATDLDALRDLLRAALQRMFSAPPAGVPVAKDAQALTPEKLDALAAVMIDLFTASQAIMWFAVAMLNLWLGGRVVHKSERLMRPWPDLSQIRLPTTLPIAFAVALALSFLKGYPGMIASGFAAALMMTYVLVGLAILHHLTRGHALRSMILSGTYAALVLFAIFTAPVLALVGLAEPFSPLRRSPPPPDTTST